MNKNKIQQLVKKYGWQYVYDNCSKQISETSSWLVYQFWDFLPDEVKKEEEKLEQLIETRKYLISVKPVQAKLF